MTLALGTGLGFPFTNAMADRHPDWVPDPTRYMPFSMGWRWPAGFVMVAGTGLGAVGGILAFPTGPWDVTSPRFHFSGWACTEGGNAPQETVYPTAAFDIGCDISNDRINWVPFDFGSSASFNMPAQNQGTWATADITLPKDSIFYLRPKLLIAEGQSYIGNYRIQKHRNEKMWGATDWTALQALMNADAPNTAALDQFYNTVGNASNSQLLLYGPDLMVGLGWDGRPIPVILNDSLVERQEIAASADTRRNLGLWRRWLDEPDLKQGRLVGLFMGVPGSKAANELTGSGASIATRRWAIIDEVKALNGGKNCWTGIATVEDGSNDNSTNLTTWQTAIYSLTSTRFLGRYPGTKMLAIPIPGRTSVGTSLNFQTVSGQTISTPWSTNLDTINDALRAGGGGRFGDYLDVYAFTMDPANHGKFKGAESFPIGNVSGATTSSAAAKVTQPILPGARVNFETVPGSTYTTQIVLTCAPDGGGLYDIVLQANMTLPDGAAVFGRTTEEGTHLALYGIMDVLSRWPQSEKAKFYPVI
ncbi:hypothetical protein [Rhizobium leguminosarum]|uniref:hypothetical protein n=1 Tax=Rhizobium leguminosarum TaxID=384 RepID=UPI001C98AAFC|nr:hypothetical protein [Rhizobium leguminosarum]MBY5331609.1 hypothetical protein [Rhizobium leguminosarum]